jgi:serine/alanine adding enzyme
MLSVRAFTRGDEWDAFVDAAPSATGYHLWAWREVFERALGHKTEYLGATEGGRLVGILPLALFDSWLFGRFAVSLPFLNYGGVVAADDQVAGALLEAAMTLGKARGLSHVELRHAKRCFPDLPSREHKVAMLLPLEATESAAWERLDRKVRNQVRKAQKEGFTTHDGGSDLLPEFYEVFARNMRDLGTPVLSKKFFAEIVRQFPDRTRVFVIRDGVRPIAAAITFAHRRTIEVPWASSLRSYRTSAANMLLYWTAIRHAVAAGHGIFDFGRSTAGEGTFHFKRQWGAAPEPLFWEYGLVEGGQVPDFDRSNGRFSAAIKAWQHVPVWVTRAVGPSIVRNIPA